MAREFVARSMHRADFSDVDFTQAHFYESDLTAAIFDRAKMVYALLTKAKLREARFLNTSLAGAILTQAQLINTTIEGANLSYASLIGAVLRGGSITESHVYGVCAWDVDISDVLQRDLIVTRRDQPRVTVDDIEVAQLIYVLLNRKKLRNFLDTMTSKAVLVLGRFTPERKVVLDAIASELRRHNLLPMIFDFERSPDRDFTETIKALASLSLFVIADITQPKSTPLELQATVPELEIPFVPIVLAGEKPFSMFNDLRKYGWVLKPLVYDSTSQLIEGFQVAILDRAWKKRKELEKRKSEQEELLSIGQYLSRS
jgi:hypothetical protein